MSRRANVAPAWTGRTRSGPCSTSTIRPPSGWSWSWTTSTPTRSGRYEAFPPAEAKRLADRLEIHYTPKHGSWLNIAEIELSVLGRQCLHRRIPDIESLATELRAWERAHNERRQPVRWQFTTADARTKLAKLYPTIPV